MSGHEKFYIPHDDLLALKTAMESLETDLEALNTAIDTEVIPSVDSLLTNIETLNTNLETLSTCFLQPGTETSAVGEITLDAGTESEIVFNTVLSATQDVYLIRARAVVVSAEDIFKLYVTDITISIDYEANPVFIERFCDGTHGMTAVNPARTAWVLERMFDLKEARIPAGQSVKVKAGGYVTPADAIINVRVYYRVEVVL